MNSTKWTLKNLALPVLLLWIGAIMGIVFGDKFMVQIGKCTNGDYLCITRYGSVIIFSLLLVIMLVTAIIDIGKLLFEGKQDIKVVLPEPSAFSTGKIGFTVENHDAENDLVECYGRIENLWAIFISETDNHVELIPPYPFRWYAKKLNWASQVSSDGNVTVGSGDRQILDIIEVGRKRFCFLFHNDVVPVDIDEREEGLQEGEYLLELKLFGKKYGKQVVIHKCYRLSLMVMLNFVDNGPSPTLTIKEISLAKLQDTLKSRQKQNTKIGIPFPKEIIVLKKDDFLKL